MKLPNGDRAVVALEKLTNYCLSPEHPRGRHKARVFATALGLTSENASQLRHALLNAALIYEAVEAEQDEYGQRYVLDFVMIGPVGQSTVRSTWIIRAEEDFPRFVTCFVL
ncbi:MAG TPA: hypothetical protein VND68_02830 [Chloroflexia bacterium]|nr:hypothetical protein [Chloroflexia bacterium]